MSSLNCHKSSVLDMELSPLLMSSKDIFLKNAYMEAFEISANRGRLAMDNCEISTVGEVTGSLADTFSKVRELDLTKNLISDWNQVRVDSRKC